MSDPSKRPAQSTPRCTKRRFSSDGDEKPPEKETKLMSESISRTQVPTATAQAQNKDLELQSYTIGWISALPIELAAAKEMMDEVYPKKPNAVAGDTNTYILGRVGDHNVVLACLPSGSYGTNSAAVVASHMMATFPNLRFGLMVGIGGGVPSKNHDVRLGDVVVSKPEAQFGGVIQVDLGKDTTQGFKLTGMLNKPPNLLMSALSEMEADSIFNESGALPDILDDIRRRHPRKAEELSYDSSKDELYEATYDHPRPMDTCDGCDERKLINRPERSRNDPIIHYGLIASGNQVEKNGPNRDRLKEELGVLCFEMEAAGLMNHFPCIVIRGICDYADSHKNKRWQLYAAMVAAAYAKEFLAKVPPAAVENVDLATKVSEQLLTTIDDRLDPLLKARQSQESEKILDWLSKSAHRARHMNLHGERKGNAGQWFLDSQEFQKWVASPKSTLFCPGIPGAGKTFVASRVIDHLFSAYEDDRDKTVVYVYCEYARQSEQTSSSLVAAILRQLSECSPSLPEALSELARNCKVCQGKERQPTYSELNATLVKVAQYYRHTFLVIDALDECSNEALRELIPSIQDLCQKAPVSPMLTSRSVPGVIELLKWDIRLSIEASKEDIRIYLDTRSCEIAMLRKNPVLKQEAVESITEAADGMLLLARLHFDTLSQAYTPGGVKRALQNFRSAPQGQTKLDKAYRNAIERIEQRDRDCTWAYRILTWVVYVIRPLSARELQHALAIRPGQSSLDNDDFPDPAEVISLCAGLVTINEETDTVQLVHYTTKEFFENYKPEWMLKAHEELSVFCLTYLSYSKFAALAEEGVLVDTTREAVIAENAFLSYAAGNWGHHVSRCGESSWRSFEKLLINYLGSKDLVLVANKVYHRNGWRWSHYLSYFGLSGVFEYIVGNKLGHNFASLDIDYSDEFLDSPLHVAIEGGNVDVVRFLLNMRSRCEVDVSSPSPCTHLTPLGCAINKGDCEVLSLLAELPPETIDFNSTTNALYELPPFIDAIFRGSIEIMELLLHLGPDRVDPYSLSSWGTPFRFAASTSNCKIMEMLLSSCPDVDPDERNEWGMTPLMEAAENGNADVVKFLANLGPEQVDVNACDEYGETGLHKAAYMGHAEVVEVLCNLPIDRVDIDPQTANFTPQMRAAGKRRNAVVDYNARIGNGRVNLSGKEAYLGNWIALTEAADKGHIQVVKSLCSLSPEKLDVNLRLRDGRTALHLAIAKGHSEIAEVLIGLGERVNFESKDVKGNTARSLAAAAGSDLVKLFPESSR